MSNTSQTSITDSEDFGELLATKFSSLQRHGVAKFYTPLPLHPCKYPSRQAGGVAPKSGAGGGGVKSLSQYSGCRGKSIRDPRYPPPLKNAFWHQKWGEGGEGRIVDYACQPGKDRMSMNCMASYLQS